MKANQEEPAVPWKSLSSLCRKRISKKAVREELHPMSLINCLKEDHGSLRRRISFFVMMHSFKQYDFEERIWVMFFSSLCPECVAFQIFSSLLACWAWCESRGWRDYTVRHLTQSDEFNSREKVWQKEGHKRRRNTRQMLLLISFWYRTAWEA